MYESWDVMTMTHSNAVLDTTPMSHKEPAPRKRIGFIGIKALPSTAGADRVVEAIARNMDPERYEPIVYCSASEVPKGTSLPGIRLIRIRAIPGARVYSTSLFLFSALHALLFSRYDLIHLHNLESSFVLPLLRLRYPVITTSHGPTQNRIDKWGSSAIRIFLFTEWLGMVLSNAVTSVSETHLEYFRTHYRKPVHYIPNGVDINTDGDVAKASRILDAVGVSPGDYIVFAGRIMPTKGCHVLLDAFLDLDTDVNLVIVGDSTILPEYSSALRAKANERVRFVDFIGDKPTLLGLVKMCRIFVHPSTVEAMSMMLLEAATMKAPIICSDIPENTHVIRENALVFEAENAADLTERLAWALAHPQEMKALGEQGFEWVSAHYGWGDVVRQYEQLYDEHAKRSPAKSHIPVDA